METSKKRGKGDRRLGGRLRPHFDGLESRMALSGSTLASGLSNFATTQIGTLAPGSSLSIASINPAPSAVLSSSPSTIQVTFDRPVDGVTVGNADFKLVHVASDGSSTPLKSGEATFSEALDPSDPTGRRISLTLNKPLVEGSYRLILSASSQLQGRDGSSLAGVNGSSKVLSGFSIGPAESGLAGATDLKTVGPAELVQADKLNLDSDPNAVDDYKLTLAPGHQWRLGLEITATSEGSPLTTDLSLFDSGGHLIATDNVGLPGDPGDPYLFAGVGPGTYYVGVSARNNIPDSSGAYDAIQIVNAGASEQGGAFHLHVVADPADSPTQVLGLRLDRADPLSADPTGLTLQLSDAIRMTSLANAGPTAATLVDQDGQAWSLTPTHYNGNLGQLSFVFDQPLPSGTYTLRLGNHGELVDLGGRAPSASNQASGMLGTFTVTASTRPAGDLGPILPKAAEAGLAATYAIAANSSTSHQFTVVAPGIYVINGLDASSGITYSLADAGGNVIKVGLGTSASGQLDVPLTPGLYSLTLTNPGSQAVQVPVTIREKQVVFSQLLDGGVAQGAAFGLRLVTPQANFGAGSDAISSPSSMTAAGINPQPSTGSSGNSSSTSLQSMGRGSDPGSYGALTIGLATPGVSLASAVFNGTAPVGRPSSQANQISVVGPSGPSGSVALASNTAGLPSGLVVALASISTWDQPDLEVIPVDPEVPAGDAASLRRASTLDAGLLARPAGSRRADDRILHEADWIDRVVSNALGWMGQPSAEDTATVAASPGPTGEVAGVGAEPTTEVTQVQIAGLSSPLAIGVILSSIAYGYREKLRAQFRTRSKVEPKATFRAQPGLAGPHRRDGGRLKARAR